MPKSPVPVGRFAHLNDDDHVAVAALCGWQPDGRMFKIEVERAKQTPGFPMTKRIKNLAAALQRIHLDNFAATNGIDVQSLFRTGEDQQAA